MEQNADYVCHKCGAELTGWNAAAHHEWIFHNRERTTHPVEPCQWCGKIGFHTEICEGFVINDPAYEPTFACTVCGFTGSAITLAAHRCDEQIDSSGA